MSLIAGIFRRNPETPISESACEALKAAVSRYPKEHIEVFKDSRAFLVKFDIGAFGEPAFRIDPTGSVTMMAGEPLLRGNHGTYPAGRARELEILHHEWDKENWKVLDQAQGTFCAAHYRPDTATLSLVADKLGVRPLYYWVGESYVVFAGALRVLEGLSYVPKKMDMRSVTEMASFGYPLGNRTPYCGIFVLREAEVLRCSEQGVTSHRYWRWDSIPTSTRDEPQLLREVHERFITAVARRLRGDKTTVAFLSGGLDTRCIVAALRAHQARVHTFNFSSPGSQDRIFGAQFANAIGAIHYEGDMSIAPELFRSVAQAWQASKDRERWPAERPMLIWSGDGGSVGLGHVYMSAEAVSLLRSHKLEHFLRQERHSLVRRLLRPRVVAALSGVLHAGILEEFKNIHSEDPGRDLYVFLLVNDQRRHLASFYENPDLNRIELQLPFFDGDFLASVIAVPLDLCLDHRFYNKWLSLFQPEVSSVPWQAYPGHAPCPVQVPRTLDYQWDPRALASWRAKLKSDLLRESGELLSKNDFPDPILNKQYLRLARLVYRLGLRDCGYVLKTALHYYRYWAACAGEYAL
jgi:asparagine synthase (glutamine-hydrolysing)